MTEKFQKFRADHSGKCVICHQSKPLDAMIKEVENKGYECVDCVVQDKSTNLNYGGKLESNFSNIIDEGKFNKLIKWCLG